MQYWSMYLLLLLSGITWTAFAVAGWRFFGLRATIFAVGGFIAMAPWQSLDLVSNAFCGGIDVALWIESAPLAGGAACSAGRRFQWIVTLLGLSLMVTAAYPYIRLLRYLRR